MALKRGRSSWSQDVLARHGADLQETVETEAAHLDAIGWERIERKQWLEVAQTFDPTASLSEELLVRLIGESALSSGLKLEWEGLLKPLQQAVSALSEHAALELSGFSKGSSVLHFRAVRRAPVERLAGDLGDPIRETPLAGPVRRFMEVVDAVENERDVRAYSASSMLGELQKLSEELERLHLEADFKFYSRGGDVRAAQLSERGMGYMKALAEPQETEESMAISGRVTELKESGHAKIKAGVQRNATAYDVHVEASSLTAMRLVLGQNVHWLVNAVATKDRLGRLKSLRFEYIRDLGLSEQEELVPDEGYWTEVLPEDDA